MSLPNDLLSQFVKITNDSKKPTSRESIVYGTIHYDGQTYVKIDGSDILTPVTTTAAVEHGERVAVTIKDHMAVVTGNITSPAVREGTVNDLSDEVTQFENVMAYKVTANDIQAVTAIFDNLLAKTATMSGLTVENLAAINAEIETLKAKYIEGDTVSAKDITALTADIESLRAVFGEFKDLSTEDFDAVNAEIDNLKGYTADFTYVSADRLTAVKAEIRDLDARKITADDAKIICATIDFANIEKAAIENLYTKSGLIENIKVGDGYVTGMLVGVTIKGDMIEGNTIVADKLVIKGDDGLYYKLNTQGVTSNSYADRYVKMEAMNAPDSECVVVEEAFTTEGEQVYSYTSVDDDIKYCTIIDNIYYEVMLEANAIRLEQTEYNSLNGSIITAKSITAEQISVNDLVAFGATIGGFSITSGDDNGPGAIYSEVKDSEGNTTRGIYLDTDGQVNIGDATNYIKYVQNDDGTYSLAISAKDITYALNGAQHSLSELGNIGNYVKIGTYENEACIELGSKDSDFKLIITNTQILFMEGSIVPAYMTNQSLHIRKAVIEEEMRLGQFVWQIRPNGNMGLIWQDVVEEVSE